MQPEDQVCSLEISMELKKLGVSQQSFFHWYVSQRSSHAFILESKKVNYTVDSRDEYDVYSAFTTAELLNMLPCMIKGTSLELLKGIIFGHSNPTYCARYFDAEIICKIDENSANACANLLMYLINNKLTKV